MKSFVSVILIFIIFPLALLFSEAVEVEYDVSLDLYDKVLEDRVLTADITGDSVNEIIIADKTRIIVVDGETGTILPGWPVSVGLILSRPAINDKYIAVVTKDELCILNFNGTTKVNLSYPGVIPEQYGAPQYKEINNVSAPTFSDIDNDGTEEILFSAFIDPYDFPQGAPSFWHFIIVDPETETITISPDYFHYVHNIGSDGFNINVQEVRKMWITVGDFSGSGEKEIMMVCGYGMFHPFSNGFDNTLFQLILHDGTPVDTYEMEDVKAKRVIFHDEDNDGDLEVLLSNNDHHTPYMGDATDIMLKEIIINKIDYKSASGFSNNILGNTPIDVVQFTENDHFTVFGIKHPFLYDKIDNNEYTCILSTYMDKVNATGGGLPGKITGKYTNLKNTVYNINSSYSLLDIVWEEENFFTEPINYCSDPPSLYFNPENALIGSLLDDENYSLLIPLADRFMIYLSDGTLFNVYELPFPMIAHPILSDVTGDGRNNIVILIGNGSDTNLRIYSTEGNPAPYCDTDFYLNSKNTSQFDVPELDLCDSAPVVSIETDSKNYLMGEPVTITVMAESCAGLSGMWWWDSTTRTLMPTRLKWHSLKGEENATYSWTFTPAKPGKYIIYAKARDAQYGSNNDFPHESQAASTEIYVHVKIKIPKIFP
ncbi:hypothetical protein ACFL1F_00490 [Chlamydiota bacterium]